MSACDPQTFHDVNDAAWDAIKQTARDQYGVAIDGAGGSIRHSGFAFTWTLDDARTLTVQCTDSPFFAPCALINEKMQELIGKCVADHRSDVPG
ncbi:MAG TPA: hypothetical protein VFF06_01525 [Polyangia bacterium]|nr:hypothetical protein [Polyangia bacterium]